MLVAITMVLRLKIYCNLETVPSTARRKNKTLWLDSAKSHIQVVAYRKLNCGHPICYILYNKEPFSTVLLFLIFADKSALYIWFLTSILS